MYVQRNRKYLLFFTLSTIWCMILTSCEKKVEKKLPLDTPSRVSELTLTQIAESNLKIVAFSQKAQENKIQNTTKVVLEEIEKNHIELKNKIRKIAKDNLIIIPNILYDTTTLKSFINEVSTELYLDKIRKSLEIELKLYQAIMKGSQSMDLKRLATDAIAIIQKNMSSIEEEQQTYQ